MGLLWKIEGPLSRDRRHIAFHASAYCEAGQFQMEVLGCERGYERYSVATVVRRCAALLCEIVCCVCYSVATVIRRCAAPLCEVVCCALGVMLAQLSFCAAVFGAVRRDSCCSLPFPGSSSVRFSIGRGLIVQAKRQAKRKALKQPDCTNSTKISRRQAGSARSCMGVVQEKALDWITEHLKNHLGEIFMCKGMLESGQCSQEVVETSVVEEDIFHETYMTFKSLPPLLDGRMAHQPLQLRAQVGRLGGRRRAGAD